MHFLSKYELLGLYGCKHSSQFLKLIGEEGKLVLNWQPGKHQRFTPKQIRNLYELIGEPLTRKEMYGQ